MKNPKLFYNKEIVLHQSQYAAWIVYDNSTRTLLVVFRNCRQYVYKNVPAGLFRRLINANNRGSFLYHNVIHAGFDVEQLEEIVAPAIMRQKLEPPRVFRWLAQ